MEEFDRFMELSFENKKDETLQHIVDYLNANYKEAKIKYENNIFTIQGDNEDAQLMRKELDRFINFSAKNNERKRI